MVAPLWPPMTVTGVSLGLAFEIPARKRAARTTSRVVTPKRWAGSNTPAFSRVEATIGTVELTGFEITRMCAVGATRATAVARSRTMDALVWRKTVSGYPGRAHGDIGHIEQVVTGHLQKSLVQAHNRASNCLHRAASNDVN